jgi:hypothetical protein
MVTRSTLPQWRIRGGSLAGRKPIGLLTLLAALAAAAIPAGATPSSTVWTNMTLDIQAFSVFHLGVDNYFTVFRDAEDGGGSFPTDLGLTVGILPFEKFQMEVGIDLVEASDNPLFGNLKMGAPEGALWKGSPALQVGIFSVGTEAGVTDYNVVYGVIGKTIPGFGRISAGPYIGNDELLRSSQGKEEDSGFMVAFDRGFGPVDDGQGSRFNRFVLAADYASGDNAIGGGAVGLYYFFTPTISLLTGPVWFNDEGVNGEWKWTVQLDINLPKLGR